jgi:polyphosphate kinase 2 (PPK2 family)
MEKHMVNHGVILFKFWIHIDKEEQLKRFQSRQEDPLKQYKITDEDWRNREKWDEYEKAVDEMLWRTNTDYAKWNVIESNDKKYARIKTLEYVVNELERQL